MGIGVVEAYRNQAGVTLNRSGVTGLAWLWLRALADALWNGFGERLRPAASWRRTGNWGATSSSRVVACSARRYSLQQPRNTDGGTRRVRSRVTAVDKVLFERMPYHEPGNLYFVWRDQSTSAGLKRDWLAGPGRRRFAERPYGVIERAVGLQLSVPTLSARSDGEPLQTLMLLTSPHLFELLGVTPMLGRGFAANEVGPNRPSVVVLSHVSGHVSEAIRRSSVRRSG